MSMMREMMRVMIMHVAREFRHSPECQRSEDSSIADISLDANGAMGAGDFI